ncbi:MAG: hypothetical protein KY455_00820 [Euryarchaeota archaeon]|nr:hypothetical protein [Euryarchaeota archaeon]
MSTRLEAFRTKAEDLVNAHPIVRANSYCAWFAQGDLCRDDVRHLTVQFSVFSQWFIQAQLRKVLNATSLESYREGKEILMNELGVVFRADSPGRTAGKDVDPELVGVEGTVEGGTYHHRAAHFEWLIRFAEPLGLGFNALGKRRHGTPSTLHFVDELSRIYGSEDYSTGAGASYAVEHWANAGFWKQLVAGLKAFKEKEGLDLSLGFWTWHDQLEQQHADHTDEELEEAFAHPEFDPDRFLAGAREMLDGVQVFWEGLARDAGLAVTAKTQ